MKPVIQVHKEGKWFVDTDLVTTVADQGRTNVGRSAVKGKA
jgi:hypothetical protein